MLLCKRIHGNDRTGVIDFHGDSQCVVRVLLKVTCESNDPYEVKRCHCMKLLRNISCPQVKVVNWTGVLQIELYNSPVKCHALQGHVNPMTPLRWKGVTTCTWKAYGTSCPQVMVVNRASVLQIELHNSPVKCHAFQGHVNPMTPLRWKGVTTWKA